jgi:hypothetical protein
MATPIYRSPALPRISETVIGWLVEPEHRPLAPQVAEWDEPAWEAARWAVQVHGIGPLLDRAAERWPDADALHPRLRAYLAAQRRLSGERVALLLGELAEILAALDMAGVPAIPLKGSLLATGYYPEPGLRPMNDLDVLIRPEDEGRACDALGRLGYRPIVRSWKHAQLARPEARGPTVAFDGEHPDNPRSLDLHMRLAERFWSIRYDLTGDAWAGADAGELLGRAAWVMRPAALLHHLAVHASCDAIARRLRLLHLYDIALAAARVDRVGWEALVAGAQTRREERFVYPALALAARYFPAVPKDVLAALRPGVPAGLLRHLDAAGLHALSYCNPAPSTLRERLIWYRPGRERLAAVRQMVLPDRDEIVLWYPRLARPALLPLAYARYAVQMIGWGLRRALGGKRLKLFAPGAGEAVKR